MTKRSVAVIQVRVAWWLKWYLCGVALTCQLTGLDHDEQKVARYIRRAVKVKATIHP